jgi:hypothetical protein
MKVSRWAGLIAVISVSPFFKRQRGPPLVKISRFIPHLAPTEQLEAQLESSAGNATKSPFYDT